MKRCALKRKKPMKRGNSLRQRSPLKSGKASTKKRKPLRKVSRVMANKNKEYLKLRAEYISKHPFCERPCCSTPSSEVHHKAGRGKFLLRSDTFMALCQSCHRWIHDNPSWAKTLGYILGPEKRRLL